MPSHNELLYERIANELNRLRGYREPDAPGLVLGATGEVVLDTGRDVVPYTPEEVQGFIDSWVAVFIGENLHFEGDFTPDDYATIIAHNLFVGGPSLMDYGDPEAIPGGVLDYAETEAEKALIRFAWRLEPQLRIFPNAPTRSYQLGEMIHALVINGRISEADAIALTDDKPSTQAANIAAADNFESLLNAAPQIMSELALGRTSTTNLVALFHTELGRLGEGPVSVLIPGWVEPERRPAEQREAVEDRLAGPQKAALDDPAKAFTDALAAANPDIDS